jgi:hypothetical protein
MQSYLLGLESLREFQQWFLPVIWVAAQRRDETPLMRTLELRLAEFTNGHRTEPELRRYFRDHLQRNTVTVAQTRVEQWRSNAIHAGHASARSSTTTDPDGTSNP